MAGSNGIVVATSIPPKLSRKNVGREVGADYQRLCVRSWLDCGFRILSVNDAEEIPDLSKRFPEVEFVEAKRNASAISGRKNPYIADLLSALADAPEVVAGLVNADILFEPTTQWRESLPLLSREAVVTGQRLDAESLMRGCLREYPYGFDYFFFDRSSVNKIVADSHSYAMGIPWWDYWLPLALAFNGQRLLTCKNPSIIHLAHEARWRPSDSKQLVTIFAEFVIRQANNLRRYFPTNAEYLLSLCSELSGSPSSLEGAAADETILELAKNCSRLLRSNAIDMNIANERPASGASSKFVDSTDNTVQLAEITPAQLFENARDRVEAAHILESILALTPNSNPGEFERLFGAALEKAPGDSDILFYAGLFALDSGNLRQAIRMFRQSSVENPLSGRALNSLGLAQFEQGDIESAIECFQRSLEVNPAFGGSYRSLALALHSLNRPNDVILCFEKMLTEHPTADNIDEYIALRGALRQMSGERSVPLPEYYGQHGEDALLDEFFGFKPSGFFVDVGAFDGIYLSNSYAFERRGWSGICVEPAPAYYELCVQNRPGSRCHNVVCSSNARGDVTFKMDSSGLFSAMTIDTDFVSKAYERSRVPFQALQTILVQSTTLENLLGDAAHDIDFLSIDVEGAELDVLRGLNLDRFKPRVLVLEANNPLERQSLDDYLLPRGYRWARSLKWNHFYVRTEEDRRALRSIVVAAKLARPSHPLVDTYDRFGYSGGNVFWHAEL